MATPGTHPDSGLSAPDRWRRIESLFHAASEMPEADRAAFLNQACGADADLLREVESLLASSEHTLGFLQTPVQDAAQQVAAQSSAAQRVGPYELIRLIGSGGMGDVYLAERADEQFRRKVAIKLMRAGLEQSHILLPRFSAEREILASLDHPNIARLLDGGVTAQGVPYLVMEYVEGLPIDEYCAANNLGVDQKLQLFQRLCAAVEYAHQHFVVHRDIKPQNVLVTPDGTPKLLDFGIAKLLDPESGSMEATRKTQRMMTPEYASPEQILGKPITTASDVYGLGVLLYELLAGRRPFRVRTGSNLELSTLICEQEPDSPGAGKELDSIVLKALAKDPALRYASAAQLSEDLGAYLTGYPLLSQPRTWRYQARKWIGRHKGAAAASALLVLVLIGLTTAMAVVTHRAREESLRAERESKFLVNLFKAATPEVDKGREVTARDLLDQAAKRIDQELAAVPDVHASMLATIAQAYVSLGLYKKAEDLAERCYRLRLKTSGPDRPETVDALYLLADLVRKQGEYARAEPLFRKLVAQRKKLTGEKNSDYATSLGALGECLYQENKDAEAESLLRQALSIDRGLGPDTGDEIRNYLALVLERRGEYGEAGALLKEAVEIGARTKGVDNPDYAISLHNLASALIDQGDLKGAETRLRETLAIRRRVLGNEHPMLAYTLNNLGYVLLEQGNPSAAEPFFREALDLNTRRMDPGNPQLAPSLNNWARLQQALGNYSEAAKYYDRALSVLRGASLFNSWPASQILLNMGVLEFDQGHYAAAETWAQQSLEMKRKLGGENSLALDGALIELAEDQLFQGDAQGAEPMIRQALELRQKKFTGKHPAVVAAQVRLGEALIAEGREFEAQPILHEAVSSARTAPFPLLKWQIAEAESALAACEAILRHTDEAQRLERESQPGLSAHPRPPFRQPAITRLLALNQQAHRGAR
jgi:tetratricopeptide (TPR) repeat protein